MRSQMSHLLFLIVSLSLCITIHAQTDTSTPTSIPPSTSPPTSNTTITLSSTSSISNDTASNNTIITPNSTSISNTTIIPSSNITCPRGTRLNNNFFTCDNVTSCIPTINISNYTTSINVINITTGISSMMNVTIYIHNITFDNEYMWNQTSCITPNYTYKEGCILPLIPYNSTNNSTGMNVTGGYYLWNSTFQCNITSPSNLNTTWNTSQIITNTSCINGQIYLTSINITTIWNNITINSTYWNLTSNDIIFSNTTTLTNQTCPTIAPTPSSTEIDANPTSGTNTSQDKAAGTAMALILGFSSLGVGVLYWCWFRIRRQKQAFQQAQQHINQNDDEELEEEQI